MKKSGYVLFLFFLVPFFLLALSPILVVKSQSRTLNVPDDYGSIQEAIIHAHVGDTVFVSSGSYREDLFINRPLSLIGEDKDTTVIKGGHEGTTLLISRADDVTVTGFTIRSYDRGVHLLHAENCTLSRNNIVELYTSKAVWLYGSSHNVLSENTVKGGGSGIELELSSNNTIFDNKIVENDGGISLLRSPNNVVCANILEDNVRGIVLKRNSSGNTFYANRLAGSNQGIVLGGSGIYVTYVDNNVFHHNNFLDNMVPVEDRGTVCGVDYWDNGAEGNYWSDYNGSDQDGDKIGNIPHLVYENYCNGNNTDRYPLMKPANIFVIPEFPSEVLLPILLMSVTGITLTYRYNLNEYLKGNRRKKSEPQ